MAVMQLLTTLADGNEQIKNFGTNNETNYFKLVFKITLFIQILYYTNFFRYVMDEVSRDPRVPSLRRLPLSNLTNLKDLLDRCQKSLDDFLEVCDLQIKIFFGVILN